MRRIRQRLCRRAHGRPATSATTTATSGSAVTLIKKPLTFVVKGFFISDIGISISDLFMIC